MTEQDKQNKISGLVTAIVNKVTSLISIHDNDNNSHSDIRNSIPDPATSNPSADTQSGSVGGSANYAKADHTHPKSSLYDITVEKQQTAETGFVATYVIKQNNTQVGSKINIPKDFLVKSATMKACSTANSPLNGLKVGDPYLDFIVNTIDNDETDNHIYINVSDLVSDDRYTASTGLTLTNNAFSVNIADNVTTNDATKVLSAKQGKWLNDNKAASNHTHTKTQITDFPTLATVATSGSYNDLSNKPTIDSSISSSSTNAIQNKAVYSAINGLTGDNIKLASNSNESISSALSLKASSSDARLSDARTPLFNKIPATSSNIVDLNNYHTGGFYFIDNDSNSPYIIHCPNSNGTNTPYSGNKSFFLIVEQWTGNSCAVKQTLTYYNTNETYVRTKASTSWLPWKKVISNYDSAGGTNILKNTQAFVGTNNDSNGVLSGEYKSCIIRRINNTSGSTYSDIVWTIPSGEHHHGERYTLSFWAKGSGSVIVYNYGSTNYIKAKVIACTNGGTSNSQFKDYDDGNCTFALTNTWKRYFVTWELNPTSNSSNLDTVNKLIILRTTPGSDIYYAGAMYERGEVPHDWSPAPSERITTTYAQCVNSSATAGYFKLLTIRMRNSYKDGNIKFTINRRSNEGASTDIDIGFEYYSSNSNMYYKVKYFYYNGTPINAYIQQTQNNISDGIFDFYIYAPAWGNASVNNIITNDIYMDKNAMSIMPKSEFVSSLPSGYTQATLNPYKGSNAGTGLTKSNGALSVAYGTDSNTACQGNDTRIINAVNNAVKIEWKQGATSASSRVNPANISISKGGSVNVYCINAMGTALSGQVIFVINGTAYPKTLSGGIASQTINNAGTFAVEVYYYDSNYACTGSAGAKVTVT